MKRTGRMGIVTSAALLGAAVALGALRSPPPERNFVAVDQRPAAESGSLMFEGLTRTFLRYVPNNLPTNPAPLVLVLHGGGNSAQIAMEGEFEGRWNDLADAHKFIVSYPEGRPDPGAPTSHHWNDCRADVTNSQALSTNDDVGFLEALIDLLASDFNIDSNRVYATGPSNGGLMTFRLAIERRDRLAAVATIIANEPVNSECPSPTNDPAGAIPILMMMATDDVQMPFEGGPYGCQLCDLGLARSAAETTNLWFLTNQPHPVPAVTNLPDVATNDNSTVTRFTFTNGIDGSEMVYYRIDGGGHQVPGREPGTMEETLGEKNNDIVAADEIWSFFSRHVRGAR